MVRPIALLEGLEDFIEQQKLFPEVEHVNGPFDTDEAQVDVTKVEVSLARTFFYDPKCLIFAYLSITTYDRC